MTFTFQRKNNALPCLLLKTKHDASLRCLSVRSTWCSYRGTRFNSQHPQVTYSRSQSPLLTYEGTRQAYAVHTHLCRQNTLKKNFKGEIPFDNSLKFMGVRLLNKQEAKFSGFKFLCSVYFI